MRNRTVVFGFILFLFSQISVAQLVDNKLNIYAKYQTGQFHGQKKIKEGNFLYPSFYGNLDNINGFSLKALYKLHEHFSIGIGFASNQASDWEYNDNDEYLGSEFRMKSLTANIQLHSKFSQKGILNRLKLFLEVSPVVGVSNFNSTTTIFDIQNQNNSLTAPTKSSDMLYGFNSNIGLEFSISQAIGLAFSYSLNYNLIESIMYNDNHFTFTQLNFGIIFKWIKDKHFLYRN